jgi:hypothetical protein
LHRLSPVRPAKEDHKVLSKRAGRLGKVYEYCGEVASSDEKYGKE